MTEKFPAGTVVQHLLYDSLGVVQLGGVRYLEGPNKGQVYDDWSDSGKFWSKPTKPFRCE